MPIVLGYELDNDYYKNSLKKMEYTERYLQFLKMGGGKNYEYMFFISNMVKLYNESIRLNNDATIVDHDAFTKYICTTVRDWLSRYNGHHRTIKVFLYDEFIYQQCQCCKHLAFFETKGGVMSYCRRENHKVTNGKKRCNNFEWM